MRLLGKVALGGGLLSAATAGILVAAGVFATSTTLVLADPAAPKAAAKPRELVSFDSCSALLTWYISQGVKDVGPYGWQDNPIMYGGWGDLVMQRSAALKSLSVAVENRLDTRSPSATGTNTQEAAVDEPDVAKTNGTLVARIVDDNRLVLVDVSGPEPVVTRRLHLPKNGYDNQLLLVGDHVLITQQTYSQPSTRRGTGMLDTRIGYYGGRTATRVFDVDIADPHNPRLVSTDRYSGRLLSARQYGSTIRLVTATPRPQLAWVEPTRKISRREATRRNRDLVRRTKIEDWLPSVIRNGTRTALPACDHVLHPKQFSGGETTAVTTIDVHHTDKRSAVAVTANGQVVYSSGDRLYVASSEYGPVLRKTGGHRIPSYERPITAIHAFDVSGTGSRYVGSGDIAGTVRDRWSLDEYDGRLRVAWTRIGRHGRQHNGITVLAERDGALTATGSVTDLGIDEDLQSVRWFDHLAVLVTFRQVDPLYTVDLTDQDHPRVLGALKIPGYSGYLHPLNDHLLLGLGMNVGRHGENGGAQAAVFDISHLRHPVRISQQVFGPDTDLPALGDPRGFTWIAGTSTALTPVVNWTTNAARLVSLHVSETGQLTSRTLARLNQDWQARTFALPDGRVAVLDAHRVRVVAG